MIRGGGGGGRGGGGGGGAGGGGGGYIHLHPGISTFMLMFAMKL